MKLLDHIIASDSIYQINTIRYAFKAFVCIKSALSWKIGNLRNIDFKKNNIYEWTVMSILMVFVYI